MLITRMEKFTIGDFEVLLTEYESQFTYSVKKGSQTIIDNRIINKQHLDELIVGTANVQSLLGKDLKTSVLNFAISDIITNS